MRASPTQIIRNMRSIGLDLEPWVKKGLLQFHAVRSTIYGLEMHLATIHKMIREIQPRIVVLDPIGNLIQAGTVKDATTTATRLIDFLKMDSITEFFYQPHVWRCSQGTNRPGSLVSGGYVAFAARH
jgi:circadian clock protein KaiC